MLFMVFYWFWLAVVTLFIHFQTVIAFESLDLLQLRVKLVAEVDSLGELFLKDVFLLLQDLEALGELALGADFLTCGSSNLVECETLGLKQQIRQYFA